MRITNIYFTSRFEKSFKKLPKKIKLLAIEKEIIFRQDCFHSSLKTHKLKGELQEFWSFSINRSYRILFAFNGNNVDFIDIGSHSIYR